ncbi:MAG: type II toxin-antitoxin system Phd/YefM family antitoxin [Deltaproteobacteria bacterium]|nr:type II toxin-antitoxin system Phd/YefM family antitoxin [Deltaproteobacteria bacterium]
MVKIPEIVPVSDFRQDAAAVLKKLRSGTGPLVVTQRGRAVAVMQSIEAYEQREREWDLLCLLAAGEREIAAGQGHGLDAVMDEAEALLGDDPL